MVMFLSRNRISAIFITALVTHQADAQGWGSPGVWGPGNPSSYGGGFPTDGPYQPSTTSSPESPQSISAATSLQSVNRAAAAHGVVAVITWIFILPLGAVLHRLRKDSPSGFRLHAIGQSVGLLLYLIAAAIGLYVIQSVGNGSFWNDPHPALGVVVLLGVFSQAVLGVVVRRRNTRSKARYRSAGALEERPSVTLGRIHIGFGLCLLMLAAINGGLGLRSAARTGFSISQTQYDSIIIIYGVVAGWMLILYAGIVASSVFKASRSSPGGTCTSAEPKSRAVAERRTSPPSYDESEESMGRRMSNY